MLSTEISSCGLILFQSITATQRFSSVEYQLSDIYLVIGYYLRHRDEVHAYLVERQRQANVIQQEAEQRFSPTGIRDRLLARRTQSR